MSRVHTYAFGGSFLLSPGMQQVQPADQGGAPLSALKPQKEHRGHSKDDNFFTDLQSIIMLQRKFRRYLERKKEGAMRRAVLSQEESVGAKMLAWRKLPVISWMPLNVKIKKMTTRTSVDQRMTPCRSTT